MSFPFHPQFIFQCISKNNYQILCTSGEVTMQRNVTLAGGRICTFMKCFRWTPLSSSLCLSNLRCKLVSKYAVLCDCFVVLSLPDKRMLSGLICEIIHKITLLV